MTYEEISQLIASIGIPYAYYQFPERTGQEPPFICFYYPASNDFLADNQNYQKISALRIELYTANKDFALEKAVEDVLRGEMLVYTRNEDYIDSEKMFMITYDTEVLINEQD